MCFHDYSSLTEQAGYEVRRTGFGRLSIIIEGLDEMAVNPRLVLGGDEAILVRDEFHSIVLPDFPQEYYFELLKARSVLVGEKELPPEGPLAEMFCATRSPIRRFYEADVCLAHEGTDVGESVCVTLAESRAVAW
ncbi:MAG: hypothetical protein EOM26_05255 [Alphaproteobacteria bacterium]|nr:hypothetical protein [Alphaproteobacteria bacterium]